MKTIRLLDSLFTLAFAACLLQALNGCAAEEDTGRALPAVTDSTASGAGADSEAGANRAESALGELMSEDFASDSSGDVASSASNGSCQGVTSLNGRRGLGQQCEDAYDCAPSCCNCGQSAQTFAAAACIDGRCVASEACDIAYDLGQAEDVCRPANTTNNSSSPSTDTATFPRPINPISPIVVEPIQPTTPVAEEPTCTTGANSSASDVCGDQNCCAELLACSRNARCQEYMNCLSPCLRATDFRGCRATCMRRHPEGAQRFVGYTTCMDQHCY